MDAKPADIVGLKLEAKRGAGRSRNHQSSVSELGDAAFAAASDFFVALTGDFKKRGRLPSLAEVCDLLSQTLRRCDDVIEDIGPADVVRVKPEVSKQSKPAARVGDLVAIPANGDSCFIALVVARNRFGVAYGFFRGLSRVRPISRRVHPLIEPHPIYWGLFC